MNLTDYHAKYFAYELTKRCSSDNLEKHDVVVVNFLHRKNAADQRVYQLLAEKSQLFEGVFGASDEVLGARKRRGFRKAHQRYLPALPQA